MGEPGGGREWTGEERRSPSRARAPFRELLERALAGLSKSGPSASSGLAPNWKRRGVFLMRHFCWARSEHMGGEDAEGFVAALLSVEELSKMAYSGRISEGSANALRSYLACVPEFREDWAREGRFSEACAEQHWWLGYQLARGLRADLAEAFYQRAEELRALLGEPLLFPETDEQWASMLEALAIEIACADGGSGRSSGRL